MMKDVNGVEEIEGSRIEWGHDGNERSGNQAFGGCTTCEGAQGPLLNKLYPWFNTLLSHFEILNNLLTRGSVFSFFIEPHQLCS